MSASVSSSGDQPTSSLAPTHGTISGTVTLGGKAIGGAMIVPTSLDDPPTAIPEKAVMSDAQGRYSWSLASGRYSLRAQAVPGTTTIPPGATSVPTTPAVVTVVAGKKATVDLVLTT